MFAHFVQVISEARHKLRGTQLAVSPIDRDLGIETSARVARPALTQGAKFDTNLSGYIGAQPSIIRKCLDLIGISSDMTFIDIGCGKGRPLFVAAEYPFLKLIGVELSKFVFNIASKNIEVAIKRSSIYRRISLVQGDASNPPLQGSANVLFFYNTFVGSYVDALINNIERHIELFPSSKIWLICYNPVSYQQFDRCGVLKRFYAEKIFADPAEVAATPNWNDFDSVIIYQSIGAPYREPTPGADAEVIITIPGQGADVQNRFQ